VTGLPGADLEHFAHAPSADEMDARTVLGVALEILDPARVPLVTALAPEGMVILHMLTTLVEHPRVITLDTGRLPAETHDLMDAVRQRFGVSVEVVLPDPLDVRTMVEERGSNLFYQSYEDRRRCCDVRKVLPLRKALEGSAGWITGLRRDQTPNRRSTRKVSRDLANSMIWKIAPLASWTGDEVWSYIREHDLPYNALHDRGYRSIGCAPCTRAVSPDEGERAGRWWWEDNSERECGLHVETIGREGLKDS
jgi:phosphoadenosine phosphosulfate reductase